MDQAILVALLTGGCGAACIKIIEAVVVWFLNRKAKKEDDAQGKKVKDAAQREKEQQELVDTVEKLKSANRVLMYDRIKHLCRSYLKAGEVEFSDLEDLTEMHTCYHNLGGNGKLNHLMELVEELPIKQ